MGMEFDSTLYALDSTTIDLCLSLFPWAKFRSTKAAVKMHTLIDLRGNIPTFIRITNGKVHDVNILDELLIEAGAFYVMDRGYVDLERLYLFTVELAFFVTRTKRNMRLQRLTSRPVDKSTGLRSDQTVVPISKLSATAYPVPLRRISYVDPETKKRLVFMTNNFTLPALTIAQISLLSKTGYFSGKSGIKARLRQSDRLGLRELTVRGGHSLVHSMQHFLPSFEVDSTCHLRWRSMRA
jgi:hypothetical protein